MAIIKPTFEGEITQEKMDRYIELHRALFIEYPAQWYFTPEQVLEFHRVVNKIPIKGATGKSIYTFYFYQGVKIFPIK